VRFWKKRAVVVPVVIVVVLLVGALVWSPWIAPTMPTEVRGVSKTATSVQVQWAGSNGHTHAGHYTIMRNGVAVGTVDGDQTSYTDDGLRPGQAYTYSVQAASWLRKSPQTDGVKVRVLAPSPGSPSKGKVTTNSAAVNWSAPKDSPAPDGYEILRDGSVVKAVDSKTTTYNDTGLSPATAYSYQVVARWGENWSDPTTPVAVKTVTPSLSAARLAGSSVAVKFVITNVNAITNLNKGLTWTNYWDLTPRCKSGACDVQVVGEVTPPGFKTGTFRGVLSRRGALYTGSTTAQLSECGDVQVTDVLTIRITVKSAGVDDKEWLAKTWAGTVVVDSPPASAGGGFFCSGSRVDSSITA
jgi:chitodextrinase